MCLGRTALRLLEDFRILPRQFLLRFLFGAHHLPRVNNRHTRVLDDSRSSPQRVV